MFYKNDRTSSNPIHFGFLLFSLYPNTPTLIFGQVYKGLKGFPPHFEIKSRYEDFSQIFQVFAILGFDLKSLKFLAFCILARLVVN
jgi:hypothetical protein